MQSKESRMVIVGLTFSCDSSQMNVSLHHHDLRVSREKENSLRIIIIRKEEMDRKGYQRLHSFREER